MSEPKLLDQVRRAIRVRHYSIRTEHTYVDWIKRYILFHKKRHPRDMGGKEINEFLSHLASDLNVAVSTQGQAASAIAFLYKNVLEMETGKWGDIIRAKKPKRLPVVLSRQETDAIINNMSGTVKLMVVLMYGTGMRIMELIRLRVKDIDFDTKTITVRDGKGAKDRVAVLPLSVVKPVKAHLKRVKKLHDQDLADGYGTVYLPYALERKYPNTNKEFGWQYVFPSKKLSRDPRSGRIQRHHVYESALQKSIKTATRKAGVCKPVHAHTFRHSFATHLLADGSDIRTIQELLGHADIRTTEVYTHILKTGRLGPKSPANHYTFDDMEKPPCQNQVGTVIPNRPKSSRRDGGLAVRNVGAEPRFDATDDPKTEGRPLLCQGVASGEAWCRPGETSSLKQPQSTNQPIDQSSAAIGRSRLKKLFKAAILSIISMLSLK